MPIYAQCPCGQTLQVPDQYAGMQGKCPKCGSVVVFPTAAPGGAPAAPPQPAPPQPPPAQAPTAPPAYMAPPAYTPPAYPQTTPPAAGGYPLAPPAAPPPPGAYAPPAAGGYAPPAPGGYPPPSPPGPSQPPMSTQELVNLICLPAGLFCLFLLVIACMLPWRVGTASGSGVGIGDAGIFLIFCLLLGGLCGLTYRFKTLLPFAATVAAGFGIFAFFFMLGGVMQHIHVASVGLWIGLIMSMGTAGAFITLALFRPLEAPALQSLPLPFMNPHGGMITAVTAGVMLGFLYMILAAVS